VGWTRPLAFVLAFLLCAPGCMSIDTQLNRGYEGAYVYSGVRKDFEIMGPAFLKLSFGWVFITLFDLPFSLVADTLLLPVSIPRDSERAKAVAERTQVQSDRPALVHAKTGEVPADTARRLFDTCRDLLRHQDAQLADCYAIDASISVVDTQSLRGSDYKLVLREAIARDQEDGIFIDWREPVFEPEGERVRVRATRRSTREPAESALELVVGPDADAGWRIVEETSVGWPEK
jgi:uncharacterized protein YceK